MTTNQFIDAAIIKGVGRVLGVTLNQRDVTGTKFEPMDLSDFAIRFRVLGSPTADAEVLVEHIITQFSDLEEEGEIYNPQGGEFAFAVTKEDTEKLGIGQFPITLELLDVDTLEYVDTISEGGKQGEFNKIFIFET